MAVSVRVESIGKAYRLGVANRHALMKTLRRSLTGQEEDLFWALRDLSFDVQEGEVLGILGHNGAGKSTLLKILSQITTPTVGQIKLRGRIGSLLEVGTGFHPELSGRENVYLNGAVLGMRRREVAQRFDEIVAFSEIENFIDTPVKRYSTGMRVRLAFAVAAHLEPEILIIDEVLAVGDAAFQRKCMGKLTEVGRAGRTVLFVSHNASAIERLCTRGLVLERGRLIFQGTQLEATARYAAGHRELSRSLRERTDRTGSGEVRIVGMEVRDPAGRPLAMAKSGMDLEVHLFFESDGTRAFPNLNVRLNVQTQLGAPVFMQSNHLADCSFGATLPRKGAFVCQLTKLPLPAATYRIGYRLATAFRKGCIIDAVEHAFDLETAGGDFFGNGLEPNSQAGVALVPASWRLEEGAEPTAAAAAIEGLQ